jgi:hypothetical protein
VVAREDLAHFRLFLGAALEGVGAAGVEAATRSVNTPALLEPVSIG